MKSNIFWDDTDKSIKGSFVNLVLTFIITYIIVYAIFFGGKDLINNIKELQSLIVWFFGLSFGLWSGKKTLESIFSSTSITTKSSS